MNQSTASIESRLLAPSMSDAHGVAACISWIESHPITCVSIDSLIFADSPRLNGQDKEHIRILAETSSPLPPITVHRPTMRVIDGTHRVHAALLNGRDVIEARELDCDEQVAFILAVTTNVTHGMPLSKRDRTAAAARIIAAHPQWSDRAIAAATALSDKTISSIRSHTTSEIPQLNARLGRDGRLHPLDTRDRRQEAAAMLRGKPDAGLRKVARATGLSPSTVRDVRQRISRGQDPVPDRYRTVEPANALTSTVSTKPPESQSVSRIRRVDIAVDWQALLDGLGQDPSLRYSEAGRQTLGYLRQHAVDDAGLKGIARDLPDHCASVVGDLALSCAAAWMKLADQLHKRPG